MYWSLDAHQTGLRLAMTKVVKLHDGDLRCQALLDALADVLYERGKGLPLPATLGVLRLLEYEVIQNALEG